MTLRGWPLAVAICLACGSSEAPAESKPATTATLAEGEIARVGGEVVDVDTVRAIARSRSIGLEEARDLAVSDAVLAAHARRKLAGRGYVRVSERAALARALLESIDRKARGEGPPSRKEVEEVTQLHWLELDRPLARRTHHAVVLTQVEDAQAEALARKVRAAVLGAGDGKAFDERAKAVESGDYEVTAQPLQPVAADGRVVDPGLRLQPGEPQPTYDPAFARAVHAIPEVGDVSEVARSSFGYHVILLLEELPAKRVPYEKREKMLAEEIYARRADAAVARILTAERSRTPVEVVRNVLALTSQVKAGDG